MYSGSILILLLFLFLFGWLIQSKNKARELRINALDDFQAQAVNAASRKDLVRVHDDLIRFSNEHGWHGTRHINWYICGRLRDIEDEICIRSIPKIRRIFI